MKERKKKILKIIIIALIVVTVLFAGYRLTNYYRYTFAKPDDVKDVVEGLKKQKTVNIVKNNLNEEEYITVGKLKIKNILDEYKIFDTKTDDHIVYKKSEENNTYTFAVSKGNVEPQMVDAFVGQVYGDEHVNSLKGNIKDADRKGFLKENNIKNDIDFYKFVADNYFINSNLFTDLYTLKQNYAFNLFVSMIVPKIDSWIILEGDVVGYIFNVGTTQEAPVRQIYIFDNDKQYSILTNDVRFKNDAFLIDFVSAIEIGE